MARSSSGTTAPDQPEVREERERRKAERRQAEAKAFRDMLVILYSPNCLEDVFSETRKLSGQQEGRGYYKPRPVAVASRFV